MNNNQSEIIVIHAKDFLKIFPALSLRGAQRRYTAIKDELNKKRHQYITADDVAKYEGIALETIKQCLIK